MKLLDYLLRLSDPRKVIACYTIFLVVRATEDAQADDVLLLSDLCRERATCELGFDHVSEVFTDFDFSDEEKQLWMSENLLEDINISYGKEVPVVTTPQEAAEVKWWGEVFTPQAEPHSQCAEQVDLYLRDLRHFELWAMQMWDATAKPASGLLSGNSNQLGDFDGCLGVGMVALGAVEGRYCLALVDLETSGEAAPAVRTAVIRLQAGAFLRSKHDDPGHFAPRFSTLQWGLCVPASCSVGEVEAGLRRLLEKYSLPGLQVTAVVKPDMCYVTQQGASLPLLTLVSLGFFGGILLLAVVSTVVDTNSSFPEAQELQARSRAVLAFSLRRSWQALTSHKADELPVIHGVRSVFSLLLFAAHKLMPLALTPYSNRALLTQYSNYTLSSVLRASSVFTDAFLQLSGVLTAYNLSKELSRHGHVAWRGRIIARFIRLTPALFTVVLFYAYVLEHLGAGPQWASSVTVNADLCKHSLWRNILYIQNFYPFEEMCAPHTHQLALDMQWFVLAPLVVAALHHWPRHCLWGLGLLQLLVSGLRYTTHYHHHLSDFIYHNVSVTDLYRTANLSYSQTIHRATPYIMGLLTGFFLQRHGKICLSYRQVVGGWLACCVLAAASVFYPAALARVDAVYNVQDAALYAAIYPITWALALSWLIVACSQGYGGWLTWLLCQHWMVVLSRLSYAIYLTQFIVFLCYIGNLRTSQEFSLLYAIGVFELLGVLLISLLVTLLFDLPMQEIKNILLSSRKGVKLETS